jgi:hypothetical protein
MSYRIQEATRLIVEASNRLPTYREKHLARMVDRQRVHLNKALAELRRYESASARTTSAYCDTLCKRA